MKVYVAGKFEEGKQVKVLQELLRKLGHTITFDWSIDEYKQKEPESRDALLCKQGVIDADLYVGLFVNNNAYKGALIEMGIALAEDMPVCIIGHAIDSCIFLKLPDITQFDDIPTFLSWIGGR